jgi:hypothetical protein
MPEKNLSTITPDRKEDLIDGQLLATTVHSLRSLGTRSSCTP